MIWIVNVFFLRDKILAVLKIRWIDAKLNESDGEYRVSIVFLDLVFTKVLINLEGKVKWIWTKKSAKLFRERV